MGSRAKCLALFAILFIACFLAVCFVGILGVSLGPSSACRSPTDAPMLGGSTTARNLISGERERCYLLHIPPDYDPAQPLPLVVVLHGLASNGETIQRVTGWDEVADKEDFIVAYPDGLRYPLRWNANSNMKLDVDDVQFFRDLVAQISTLASVDPARVYVNGFSNGATMSITIACRAADLVAAIGLVDPGILTEETLENCSPARPVPAIEFVGTGEVGKVSRGQLDVPHREFTPLIGWILNVDADYEALPLHAWAERWAAANSCAVAEQLPEQGKVQGTHYSSCQGNAEVVIHVLEGMGHQWPGGEPFPPWLLGEPDHDVDATGEIWEFLQNHSLEAAP